MVMMLKSKGDNQDKDDDISSRCCCLVDDFLKRQDEEGKHSRRPSPMFYTSAWLLSKGRIPIRGHASVPPGSGGIPNPVFPIPVQRQRGLTDPLTKCGVAPDPPIATPNCACDSHLFAHLHMLSYV